MLNTVIPAVRKAGLRLVMHIYCCNLPPTSPVQLDISRLQHSVIPNIMIIPDPWFDKATEADSRFVAGECDYVELWQLENGDVVEHLDTLKSDEVEDWARGKVSSSHLIPVTTKLTCG